MSDPLRNGAFFAMKPPPRRASGAVPGSSARSSQSSRAHVPVPKAVSFNAKHPAFPTMGLGSVGIGLGLSVPSSVNHSGAGPGSEKAVLSAAANQIESQFNRFYEESPAPKVLASFRDAANQYLEKYMKGTDTRTTKTLAVQPQAKAVAKPKDGATGSDGQSAPHRPQSQRVSVDSDPPGSGDADAAEMAGAVRKSKKSTPRGAMSGTTIEQNKKKTSRKPRSRKNSPVDVPEKKRSKVVTKNKTKKQNQAVKKSAKVKSTGSTPSNKGTTKRSPTNRATGATKDNKSKKATPKRKLPPTPKSSAQKSEAARKKVTNQKRQRTVTPAKAASSNGTQAPARKRPARPVTGTTSAPAGKPKAAKTGRTSGRPKSGRKSPATSNDSATPTFICECGKAFQTNRQRIGHSSSCKIARAQRVAMATTPGTKKSSQRGRKPSKRKSSHQSSDAFPASTEAISTGRPGGSASSTPRSAAQLRTTTVERPVVVGTRRSRRERKPNLQWWVASGTTFYDRDGNAQKLALGSPNALGEYVVSTRRRTPTSGNGDRKPKPKSKSGAAATGTGAGVAASTASTGRSGRKKKVTVAKQTPTTKTRPAKKSSALLSSQSSKKKSAKKTSPHTGNRSSSAQTAEARKRPPPRYRGYPRRTLEPEKPCHHCGTLCSPTLGRWIVRVRGKLVHKPSTTVTQADRRLGFVCATCSVETPHLG